MLPLLTLASGAAAAATACGYVTNSTGTRTLDIPSTAPAGRQVIDANYQSYSIEFNYMLDFAGNNS